jgi:ABC-type glycerol-3-phosphate transport system substrate-binding protein
MKRALFLLPILAILLGSCAPGPSEDEVIFWHAMGRWEPALLELVDEFNELHPDMPVRAYNMSRYQALSQKIIAAVAAGQPPTISQAYEAWTNEMRAADIIECIEYRARGEFGLEESDWEDIHQVYLDECRDEEGRLWSFPFNKSVRTLFLNRDFFRSKGFDPDKPPTNWDEWRDMSIAMTADLDDDGRNDHWGTTGRNSVTIFGNLLLQNGGDFFTPDGKKSSIADSVGVEAMEYMWEMFGSRKMGYSTFDYAYQNEFKAGRVGMMESSSVSLSFLRGTISFDLGVAPLPGRKKNIALIQGTNLVIFKKATEKQKATAWEFIKFLTSTENATRWSLASGYAPLRKSCMDQPAMRALLEEVPGLESSYDQLLTARSEPSNAAWFAGRKYLEEGAIQRVMRGKADPGEALRKTAKKIDNEIESGF